LSEVWGKGSKGGIELAKEVMRVADKEEKDFRFAYDEKKSITEKIHILATRVYGAEGVDYVGSAAKQVDELEALGFGQLHRGYHDNAGTAESACCRVHRRG